MMDKVDLNTLVSGCRWTSEMINQALVNVVSKINSSKPPIRVQFTVENWPYRDILLEGVAGYLLRSAAIGDASNMFTYSAAGFSTSDRDKAEIFARLGGEFWEEFKQDVLDVKVNMNIARAYGIKASPYASLPTV
jgi:hypothetical protein